MLDIGGSGIRMARVRRPDVIDELIAFPWGELGEELEPVIARLRLWAAEPLDRVVIAVPGVVDYRTSMLHRSHAVPARCREILSGAHVAAVTGAPTWLLNDVDLAAIAAAGRRETAAGETLLYLNLGTGVGAAVIDEQVLIRGHHSFELADLRIGSTDLMRAASARGVRRQCPAAAGLGGAGEHSRCARDACEVVLDRLAAATATACRVFGVNVVVLGGARGRLPAVTAGLQDRLGDAHLDLGATGRPEVVRADVPNPALLGAWYVETALAPPPVTPIVPGSARTHLSTRETTQS
ncbi:ROK family protein [Nocardia sp. N2S4-5]|uniref:ROK family protein n=1 Tax=Nocardia sp. N2S4-5 TaxID=3351565 RepID=UPI0037D6E69D